MFIYHLTLWYENVSVYIKEKKKLVSRKISHKD